MCAVYEYPERDEIAASELTDLSPTNALRRDCIVMQLCWQVGKVKATAKQRLTGGRKQGTSTKRFLSALRLSPILINMLYQWHIKRTK